MRQQFSHNSGTYNISNFQYYTGSQYIYMQHYTQRIRSRFAGAVCGGVGSTRPIRPTPPCGRSANVAVAERREFERSSTTRHISRHFTRFHEYFRFAKSTSGLKPDDGKQMLVYTPVA